MTMRGGKAFACREISAVKGRQLIDLGKEQHPGKTGSGSTIALQGEATVRKDLMS
jgi:hypothetical protein